MYGFLFAGQGAQYVGMGKDLYDSFPESRAIFDQAEKILGFELKRRCFEGPEDLLKLTIISQPAILTVSIAALEAFKKRIEIKPAYMAGLSLGEYTALVAAGSLSFEEGLRLVRKRAQIMEEASLKHPGKMCAILDLPFDKIKEICFKSGAEIANINAPGQIVISGEVKAVDMAKNLCLANASSRAIDLEVSGGFHSSLMSEAAGYLKVLLDNVSILPPLVPVVSNYTAEPQYEVSQIRKNLVSQIHSAVKWEESMRFMLSQGITKFFEFGPGKVLRGLMRRIEPNAQVINIGKKEDILNLS